MHTPFQPCQTLAKRSENISRFFSRRLVDSEIVAGSLSALGELTAGEKRSPGRESGGVLHCIRTTHSEIATASEKTGL